MPLTRLQELVYELGVKRSLKRLGIPRQTIRWAAIATYEAEMNIIIRIIENFSVLSATLR